jgi:SAM-dependent methyltransferase
MRSDDRRRQRQGPVRLICGVPYPDPRTTLSLLPNAAIGEWLHEHRDRFAGRLLDVGCGNRPYASFYEPLVKEAVGVDATAGHGAAVLGFADRLPFADQTFDTILCTEVLEHVGDAERAADELLRVCRPGGHVLATVPYLYPTHEAPYDFRRFTHYGLHDLMVRHGFEILSLEAKGGAGLLLAHFVVLAAIRATERLTAGLGRPNALATNRYLRACLWGPQEAFLRRRDARRPVTGTAELVSLGYMVVARRPAAVVDP